MATKAELTTGSASAATEHTEEPQLAELVTQEAGLSIADLYIEAMEPATEQAVTSL